jgi:pyrimidine-nucleoside phosphorylase
MVSGRGLGITGGTLDKLESIPGFHVHLDEAACLRQIKKIGVFMAGQTDDFCPADKRLYALRDVTATVPSRQLIMASIMSKKLAESLDRLVLDVKFGSGAFMKSRKDAELLASGLAAAGKVNGVRTSVLLSPMDEPLGSTVGNALEVREAVETLQGNGPDDLVALTLDLAAAVSDSPREVLAKHLRDGSAWQKFLALVEAQGGEARTFDRWDTFHPAPVVTPLPCPHDGVIKKIDAGSIGSAAVRLGAGRHKTTDTINPAVGFSGIRKTGEHISQGEPLLWIHAASEADAAAARHAVRFEIQN